MSHRLIGKQIVDFQLCMLTKRFFR